MSAHLTLDGFRGVGVAWSIMMLRSDMDKPKRKTNKNVAIDFTKIDFGEVDWFDEDRGFGFVKSYLKLYDTRDDIDDFGSSARIKTVFFHASKVKVYYKKNGVDLEEVTEADVKENILKGAFWYEYEETPKGLSVKRIFTQYELRKYKTKIADSVGSEKIIAAYKELTRDYSYKSIDLIGLVFESNVVNHIKDIENKYNRERELERKNYEAEREKDKVEKLERYFKARPELMKEYLNNFEIYILLNEHSGDFELCNDKIEYILKEDAVFAHYYRVRFKGESFDWKFDTSKVKIENKLLKEKEAEFDALVKEMRPLGFTQSAQVSEYIVKNKLCMKYKHLSGYLAMENDGSQYVFVGGIEDKYYARLCCALGLGNRESGARVIGFTSFADAATKGKYP